MTAVLAFLHGMGRSHRNGLTANLRGSRWAMRLVILGTLGAVGAWQWAMFLAASSFDELEIGSLAIRVMLVKLVLLLSLQMSLTVSAIVMLLSSTGGNRGFDSLLAVAPLSRFARRAVLDLPPTLVGAIAGIGAAVPFGWVYAEQQGAARSIPLAVVLLVVSAAGALVVPAATRLITWAVVWTIRVSEVIIQPFVIAALIIVVAWQNLAAIVDRPDSALGRAYAAVARMIAEDDPGAVVLPLALLAAVLVIWQLGAVLRTRAVPATWSWSLLSGGGGIRDRARSRVRLELVQQLRHPNIGPLVVLNLAVLAVVVIHPVLREHAFAVVVPLLLIEAALAVAMSAYGVTWRTHWMYKTAPTRPGSWALPKTAAAMAIVAGFALVAVVAEYVATGGVASVAAGVGVQVPIWFAAGAIAGLVVPVDDEQPFSTVTTLVLGIGLALVAGALLSRIGTAWQAAMALLLGCLLLSVLYPRFAVWRERDLVHMH